MLMSARKAEVSYVISFSESTSHKCKYNRLHYNKSMASDLFCFVVVVVIALRKGVIQTRARKFEATQKEKMRLQ